MTKTFRDILGILTRWEQNKFRLFCLLDILTALADVVFIAGLLWILHYYTDTTATLPSFLPKWLSSNHSIWLTGLFLLLFALKNTGAFLISSRFHKFLAAVTSRLSGNSLQQYYNSSYDAFTNKDTSVHIREIAFHPVEYSQYLLGGMQQLLTQYTLILFTLAAIMWFNVKLFAVLFLILAPPVTAVFYFIKKKMAAARNEVQSSNTTSHQYLQEALNSYPEAKVYNSTGFFLNRFNRQRRIFSNRLFHSFALLNLPPRFIEIFALLGLCILIYLAGNTNNGLFIYTGAFVAAAYKIIPGVVKIINITGQLKAHMFILPELARANNTSSTAELTPADTITSIEFRNISFSYPNKEILKNLSFTLTAGDFACITGKSGIGKTTLFNLLLGFLKPDTGEILINNQPQNTQTLKQYFPHTAYVKQQSFLINDTLEKNITLQEKKANPEKYEASKKLSGIEDIFDDAAGVSQDGKNISGGQQQRINIARMLYKDAPVLLLDEPLNELDSGSSQILLNHFKQMSIAGKIILMVTHDEESRQYCNKIISLNE